LLLIGCTSDGTDSRVMAALRTEQSAIGTARFTAATSIPANVAPNVDVSVTGDSARAIYAATISLPEMPSGTFFCPEDAGITYTLDFSASGQLVVEATIEPTGCQQVSLSIAPGTAWVATDDAYWPTLAADLGIAEATIYPYRLTN
jgi:hypothetical protein